MSYSPETVAHKVSLYKHVTLPYCTQVRVKKVLKISGVILLEPKSFLWKARRVHLPNEIHDVAANKLEKMYYLISVPLRKKNKKECLLYMLQGIQLFI